MKILDQSKALYVRCIKPNTKQLPMDIDSKLVAKQLRCAGMLEAIRIRKGGYPVRRDVLSFVQFYEKLFKAFRIKQDNPRDMLSRFILELTEKGHVVKQKKEIQLGKTKVFMKEHVKIKLDLLLEECLQVFKVKISSVLHMWVIKRRYKKVRRAVLSLQNWCRTRARILKFRETARVKVKAARVITRQAKR